MKKIYCNKCMVAIDSGNNSCPECGSIVNNVTDRKDEQAFASSNSRSGRSGFWAIAIGVLLSVWVIVFIKTKIDDREDDSSAVVHSPGDSSKFIDRARSSSVAPSAASNSLKSNASDVSYENIDKLTTYTTILGRAIGCGIDTSGASSHLAAWFDRTFPRDSPDHPVYAQIFLQGTIVAAERQKNGQSPDDCDQVRKAFNSVQWP